MNKKANLGSLEELKSLDSREKRDRGSRESETRVIQRKGYREWLLAKMEEYDPGGEKARKITMKYSE
jgi:hypothetical protein